MSSMYNSADFLQSEDEIENSLQFLELYGAGDSVLKRNRHVKRIKNEMAFLREYFPESYTLEPGFQDRVKEATGE